MGATSLHRDKGQTSAQFFTSELLSPGDELLASAVRPTSYEWQSVFYGAVKRGDEVFALVVPFRWDRGYWNFTYKDMDETVGPCESACPTKVLDLLTPTDSEWANQWRTRCRQWAFEHPPVKPGQTIRFLKPVECANDYTLETLTLEKDSTWVTPSGWRLRIRGWILDSPYAIVAS